MKADIEIMTDAPADYDGFGTTTVRIVGRSTRNGCHPVRVVRIPEAAQHGRWQITRYESGGYCHTAGHCTAEQFVKFGDWVLS